MFLKIPLLQRKLFFFGVISLSFSQLSSKPIKQDYKIELTKTNLPSKFQSTRTKPFFKKEPNQSF